MLKRGEAFQRHAEFLISKVKFFLNGHSAHYLVLCFSAIREDGMPGGRNKSIGPVQVPITFTFITPTLFFPNKIDFSRLMSCCALISLFYTYVSLH